MNTLTITAACSLVTLCFAAMACGDEPGGSGGDGGGAATTGGGPGSGAGGTGSGSGMGGAGANGTGGAGDGGGTTLDPVDCDEVEHDDLAAGQWHELPNTGFMDVCACANGFPDVCGSNNCSGPFSYSGAVFDTLRNRLVTWGGGHNDSYGNELYAFDVSTFTWSRLTDPSPPANGSDCVETLSDGLPNSRHTYDGMAYLPDQDALFVAGGSLACGSGGGSSAAWLYHFGPGQWQQIEPTWQGFGSDPVNEIWGYNAYDAAGDYDPVTKRVYLESTFAMTSYDPATNVWELHVDLWDEVGGRWGERSAVIAHQERQMLLIGGGAVLAYDLDNPSSYQYLSTTGPQDVVDGGAPGLAYDEASGAIVAWHGGSLFVLDLATLAWSTIPGSVPQAESSVWGRFQYVPCEDAFLGVTIDPQQNVFLYKK